MLSTGEWRPSGSPRAQGALPPTGRPLGLLQAYAARRDCQPHPVSETDPSGVASRLRVARRRSGVCHPKHRRRGRERLQFCCRGGGRSPRRQGQQTLRKGRHQSYSRRAADRVAFVTAALPPGLLVAVRVGEIGQRWAAIGAHRRLEDDLEVQDGAVGALQVLAWVNVEISVLLVRLSPSQNAKWLVLTAAGGAGAGRW
jgi:hypothetical protein